MVAVRLALSARRSRDKELELDDDSELASAAFDGDPELATMKRDRRDELRVAVRAAFAALTVRERNLMRQSYVDGLSIDELGALYGVHRATVARWIAQARESVWHETKQRLRAETNASAEEAETLMSFLQSRLDLTLGGLLR